MSQMHMHSGNIREEHNDVNVAKTTIPLKEMAGMLNTMTPLTNGRVSSLLSKFLEIILLNFIAYSGIKVDWNKMVE